MPSLLMRKTRKWGANSVGLGHRSSKAENPPRKAGFRAYNLILQAILPIDV